MGAIMRTQLLIIAGVLSMVTASAGQEMRVGRPGDGGNPEHTWGHTIPFGEQYFREMLRILENIKATEMPLTGTLADRMASTLHAGGSVWMKASLGHMGPDEFREANKGNPGILRSDSGWDSDYDKMKSGDVLVTNFVNDNVAGARKKGVYVVGVPVCYVDQPSHPRGYAKPNANGWFLKDVSDVILKSYVPYTQGIVTCPEIPEMKICPSSANALATLFWMLQAETANRYKNPDTRGHEKAAILMDVLLDRIKSTYVPQKDLIFEASATVAKKIINGAHYHVRSDHGGVQAESSGVAMGPMMTNAFPRDRGDIHLLATIEPDSNKIISEAKKAREMNMYVVSIGPGNATELRGLSDVFIDNHSPEGGGLVAIQGYDEKVGAVGGILNNVLAWIFTAQVVDEMVRRGKVPWFWMGFYRIGGKEYDDAVRPLFLEQGF